MALDCGHRTPPGEGLDSPEAKGRLRLKICPACMLPLATALNASETVTFHRCACCGVKWVDTPDGQRIHRYEVF